MKRITFPMESRISAENAQAFQERLVKETRGADEVTLDLRNTEYIASAGLRVLLKAQKERRNNKLKLIHVSAEVYDVLQMTGFTEILDVQRKLREISVNGCDIIGRGGCGECYRLDDETIVKLYFDFITDEEIEREKRYAKAAFVAGIPTAISYDVVMCQDRKGVVYEMLNAQNISAAAHQKPDRIPALAAAYAGIAGQIHATQGDPAVFQRCREHYLQIMPKLDYLTDKGKQNFETLLLAADSRNTLLHGDLNPNNVMVSGEDVLLIDMGAFSIGHPSMDIAGLRFTVHYCGNVPDDEIYPFTGMTGREQRALWEHFTNVYYGAAFEDAVKHNQDAALVDNFMLAVAMRVQALYGEAFSKEWNERTIYLAQKAFNEATSSQSL